MKTKGKYRSIEEFSKNINERFFEKVEKTATCWIWLGMKDKLGYGSIGTGDHSTLARAHRVSWIIHRGTIPENISVLHKCDNPWCVNPEHLFLGTTQDNHDDMVQKGRDNHLGNAKLNWKQISEIRKSESEFRKTLSEKYGVNVSTICRIINRKRWVNHSNH